MAVVVATLLGLLALAFVLYPLYRRTNKKVVAATPATTVEPESADAAEREQTARSALQEVELDYQLGNIAESDYRVLRERYMHRALVAIKSRYDREQEIDEEIEAQLRKMRENDEEAHT